MGPLAGCYRSRVMGRLWGWLAANGSPRGETEARLMQDPARRQDSPSSGLTAAARAIAAGATGRWLRAVSQFGLVSRAAVYLLVGYLTLRLALAAGARTAQPASGPGAVQQAARGSWGQVWLLLLAAGFAGYALTQLVEAVFRPGHVGSRISRWRQRWSRCGDACCTRCSA